MSWQDIDNQPLYGLLEDLAVTGDGVLWPLAANTLWIEDPDTRDSAGTLGPDPGGSGLITVTPGRPTGGVGVVLDSEHACMSVRGVKATGATTVTSAFTGLLRDDARTRHEFFALTRGE